MSGQFDDCQMGESFQRLQEFIETRGGCDEAKAELEQILDLIRGDNRVMILQANALKRAEEVIALLEKTT